MDGATPNLLIDGRAVEQARMMIPISIEENLDDELVEAELLALAQEGAAACAEETGKTFIEGSIREVKREPHESGQTLVYFIAEVS